jgi:acetylornithine deacetylase/succinyl-diaminopimelate desuccinylase-like protein
VVFGPGNIAQAHQPDEFVELSQLRQASRILTLVILRLLT